VTPTATAASTGSPSPTGSLTPTASSTAQPSSCPLGRYGHFCAACPGLTNGIECSGHGVCNGAGTALGSGQCTCISEYSGEACDVQVAAAAGGAVGAVLSVVALGAGLLFWCRYRRGTGGTATRPRDWAPETAPSTTVRPNPLNALGTTEAPPASSVPAPPPVVRPNPLNAVDAAPARSVPAPESVSKREASTMFGDPSAPDMN
jgi:hypothetical protein